MKLRVVRADPAGNITLFVLDPVAKADRPAVAAKLMAMPGCDAEQVGFACEPREGFDGRMEMAGGEFCGNASRAYGMLLAKRRGATGRARLTLEVSGSGRPIGVDVDMKAGTASAEMPLPRLVRAVGGGTLVHLGGIAHLVAEHAPDEAFFAAAEPLFGADPGLDAYGVIFLHDGRMTPLVKVPAVGSLIWEGSCGSGALAAAVAESVDVENGIFIKEYIQPAGTVRAEIERSRGKAVNARVGGGVTLDGPVTVEI